MYLTRWNPGAYDPQTRRVIGVPIGPFLEVAVLILVRLTGPNRGEQLPLDLPSVRLGRARDNHVQFDRERERVVGNHHAEIRLESGSYVLYDLQSTHGTFVNDQRVSRWRLQEGDVIGLAQLMGGPTLRFSQRQAELTQPFPSAAGHAEVTAAFPRGPAQASPPATPPVERTAQQPKGYPAPGELRPPQPPPQEGPASFQPGAAPGYPAPGALLEAEPAPWNPWPSPPQTQGWGNPAESSSWGAPPSAPPSVPPQPPVPGSVPAWGASGYQEAPTAWEADPAPPQWPPSAPGPYGAPPAAPWSGPSTGASPRPAQSPPPVVEINRAGMWLDRVMASTVAGFRKLQQWQADRRAARPPKPPPAPPPPLEEPEPWKPQKFVLAEAIKEPPRAEWIFLHQYRWLLRMVVLAAFVSWYFGDELALWATRTGGQPVPEVHGGAVEDGLADKAGAQNATFMRVTSALYGRLLAVPPKQFSDGDNIMRALRQVAHKAGEDGAYLPVDFYEVVRDKLKEIRRARDFQPVYLRSQKYGPELRRLLAKAQLPELMSYIPWLESGYTPTFSDARDGRAGLWGLTPAQARRHGLAVTRQKDDRFDWRLETRGATSYLIELVGELRGLSYTLAAANWKTGPLEARALLRFQPTWREEEVTLWQFHRQRYLTPVQLDYLARLMAVAAINENPETFGLPPNPTEEADP